LLERAEALLNSASSAGVSAVGPELKANVASSSPESKLESKSVRKSNELQVCTETEEVNQEDTLRSKIGTDLGP
jgi:hypothetical protein